MATLSYFQKHRVELNTRQRERYKENREVFIAKRRVYYQEHKAEIKAYHHDYNARVKMKVLSHYSDNGKPFCKRCRNNDIDVLCLDHINDEGHDHRKQTNGSGTACYKWLREHQFPEGFQVLCANCNLKKEVERRHQISK